MSDLQRLIKRRRGLKSAQRSIIISSPEHFFQLFDLVIWILLIAGVVQEGSGVGKRPGVHLKADIETDMSV